MTPLDRLARFPDYLASNWDRVLSLSIDHAIIVAMAIAIATVIGVGLGVSSYRNQQARDLVLRITGLFLTIPSLALYAILITMPGLGIGTPAVLVALVMYALLPIVRNTVTGLLGVDQAMVESAQGMGMGRWERLLRIEFPQAWPVVITGIRVSTLITIGIAALGSIINGPGVGELIFEGLGRVGTPFDIPIALSGFVGAIAVAIFFEVFYNVLYRLTTSRGMR